jgi:hypothetical protein
MTPAALTLQKISFAEGKPRNGRHTQCRPFLHARRLEDAIHQQAAAATLLSTAMKTSPPAGRPMTKSTTTKTQQQTAAAPKMKPRIR